MRRKILVRELEKRYMICHKAIYRNVFDVEIDAYLALLTDIPDDWLESCFSIYSRDNPYIPQSADLLEVWRASVRKVAGESDDKSRPKAGVGHNCRYCMVVYQRLSEFGGKAGSRSLLLASELQDLSEAPKVGEVKCFINGISGRQFDVLLEHWGNGQNPYGLTSMEIRRSHDELTKERIDYANR